MYPVTFSLSFWTHHLAGLIILENKLWVGRLSLCREEVMLCLISSYRSHDHLFIYFKGGKMLLEDSFFLFVLFFLHYKGDSWWLMNELWLWFNREVEWVVILGKCSGYRKFSVINYLLISIPEGVSQKKQKVSIPASCWSTVGGGTSLDQGVQTHWQHL